MSRSVRKRIRDFAKSSGEYLDVIIACGMSFVVATIGLLDVFGGDEFVNEAILLVLGFYSLAVMRDRRGRQVALAQSSALRCIDDAATAKQIAEDRAETTHWSHRGNTGGLLRTKLLPQLTVDVGKSGGSFGLQVELADPTDTALCEAYAIQLSANSNDHWTAERVRDDALTTIGALFYMSLRFPVRLRMAVSAALTTFTVDLSDKAVLIDPMAGGAQTLSVSGSLSHFRGYQHDLAATYAYARDLPIEDVKRHVVDPDHVDMDELNAVLVDLGILPHEYRRTHLAALTASVAQALPSRANRS
ncbi:MAG: hypothetical protein ACRD0P_19170 [Stackebrandtia sp.]